MIKALDLVVSGFILSTLSNLIHVTLGRSRFRPKGHLLKELGRRSLDFVFVILGFLGDYPYYKDLVERKPDTVVYDGITSMSFQVVFKTVQCFWGLNRQKNCLHYIMVYYVVKNSVFAINLK